MFLIMYVFGIEALKGHNILAMGEAHRKKDTTKNKPCKGAIIE